MNKAKLMQDLRKGLIDLSKIHALDKSLTNDPDIVDAALYHRFDKLVKVGNFDNKEYYSNDQIEFEFRRLKNAKYIGSALLKNKKYMNRLMRKCSGYIFNYFPAKIRNDKELFEIAIKNTGRRFFARNGINICSSQYFHLYHVVNFEIGIINLAGDSIKKDQKLMALAMKYDPSKFSCLLPEMRINKQVRCVFLTSDPYSAIIIENKSIDAIKEVKSIIKGITERNSCTFNDDPKELMADVWEEKITDNKKTDKRFIILFEPYLKQKMS